MMPTEKKSDLMPNTPSWTKFFQSKLTISERDNFTERYIIKHGAPLEHDELAFLRNAVSGSRAIIIDVGANIGLYSIALAEVAKAEANIYAFEPNPEMCQRLQSNVELNNFANVQILPYGLGEANYTAKLHVPERNKGEARIVSEQTDNAAHSVEVQTLSSFQFKFANYDSSVLKIDVEGYEDKVLLPFLNSNDRDDLPDYIQFETQHLGYQAYSEIISALKDNGYGLVFKTRNNSIYKRECSTLFLCQKDEGLFLPEWISYHKAIGFDRIVIFSNDCSDGSEILLDELDKRGEIEHHKFSPGNAAPQFAAADLAIQNREFADGEWVCWLDADEYLNVLVGNNSVKDLRNAIGSAEGMMINWRIFGQGNEGEIWPGRQLHPNFRFASKRREGRNRQVKTFFRFSRYVEGLDPHRPILDETFRTSNLKFFDADCRPVPDEVYFGRRATGTMIHNLPHVACNPVAQINHYIVRNKTLFLNKAQRGRGYRKKGSKARHTEEFFDRLNMNNTEDATILRHLKNTQAFEEKLLSIPKVDGAFKLCREFAFKTRSDQNGKIKEKVDQTYEKQVRSAIKKFEKFVENSASYFCNLCSYEGKFIPMGSPLRVGARCPNCRSLERHRLFKLFIDRERPFGQEESILHFAPERVMKELLAESVQVYHTADLFSSDVTFKLNIERISLPDECYDSVICSHVLEHVNDADALSEIYRILRPGGLAFLAVPIVEGWVETYEDPDITSDRGREIHFGQKDHVRMYGRDFRERVVASGFTLREFPAVEPDVRKYGLLRGERLFLAVKERKPTSNSNSD